MEKLKKDDENSMCKPGEEEDFECKKIFKENELERYLKIKDKEEGKEKEKEEEKDIYRNEANVPQDNISKLIGQITERNEYGLGINIYRLVNHELVPVEGSSFFSKSKEQTGEKMKNTDIFDLLPSYSQDCGVKNSSQEETTRSKSILKTRKKLLVLLSSQIVPKAIQILQWAFNIILLAFLGMCIGEYAHTISKLSNASDLLNLMYESNIRSEAIVMSSISTLFMMLVNKGDLSGNYFWTGNVNDFCTAEKQQIHNQLTRLYNAQEDINLAIVEYSSEHSTFENSVETVMLYIIPNSTGYIIGQKIITDGVLQFCSSLFTIMNLPLTSFSRSNQDINIITQNIYGDFFMSLLKSTSLYHDDIQQSCTELNSVLLGLSIACGCLLIIGIVFLFPVVNAINKKKRKLLSFLLHIPPTTIGWLEKRCSSFLDITQENKEEDDHAGIEDEFSFSGAEQIEDSLSEFYGSITKITLILT